MSEIDKAAAVVVGLGGWQVGDLALFRHRVSGHVEYPVRIIGIRNGFGCIYEFRGLREPEGNGLSLAFVDELYPCPNE